MFRKGSGIGLRASILLILSITLMMFDQRSTVFHAERMRFASAISYPFQWMVDSPIRLMSWVNAGITTQDHLMHENEELRVREILLQSRLQKLLILEKENAELRQLLQSTSQIAGRVAVARILAVALDPNIQQVVLDKGETNQVYENQPVLDGFGVIGQVIGVGAQTSRVLLVTDKQSAVPVEDYRNGIRAIAVGTGVSGQLSLINIPDTTQIQVGDLFVTSGLDLHYPVGYPVGVVAKIQPRKHDPVDIITLTPMAHLNQAEQVLLAWPSKQALTAAVEKELQAADMSDQSGASAMLAAQGQKPTSADSKTNDSSEKKDADTAATAKKQSPAKLVTKAGIKNNAAIKKDAKTAPVEKVTSDPKSATQKKPQTAAALTSASNVKSTSEQQAVS